MSKRFLRKLGTLQFPCLNGLGFQVQKLIMTNLKVFFHILAWNFFTRITLYRSPSQKGDGFEKFTDNFEIPLEALAESNSHLIAVLGDFNIKSKNWYSNDKTTRKCVKIEFVSSQHGFHQTINEPTHVLKNSSSCTDLIFTSKPNLVLDSGGHSSLHLNCHHQIGYAKYNLKILFFCPPYEPVI